MENHNSKRNEDLISEYKAQHKEYETFTTKLVSDIRKFLEAERIDCLINGRAKTVSSLSNKFARKGQKYYASLFEIPDLVGVRVIVDHPDEVERVQKIIEEKFIEVGEFEVVKGQKGEERIPEFDNKRGCFGYQSIHIDMRKGEKRVEIQVRTLLQHSWAKFSHKYFYKNEDDVDDKWKRNLFMLSAVLQLADKEFVELSEKFPSIKEKALAEFLNSVELPLQQLRERAESAGFKTSYRKNELFDVSSLIWACQKVGIKTVNKLQKDLQYALKHDDKYLTELHERVGVNWTVELAFLVELMLYRVYPTDFAVEDLIEQNWSRHLAEKVHSIAKKYHHKAGSHEHH